MSFLDKSVDCENYTMCEAIDETKCCLRCKVPSCQEGYPISNGTPDFIYQLSKGNLGEAKEVPAGKTSLPAVCGHIYPHERRYVGHYMLNAKHVPIQVGKLEESIADSGAEVGLTKENLVHKTRGKVVVIGSSPAGLAVTGDLARQGFNVVIYEREDEPGRILVCEIPEFRLPKEVMRKEIGRIEALGVTFLTNVMIGPNLIVDDMFSRNYDVIFIGTGTALARNTGLPGKNKIGILQAIHFLWMATLYNSGDVSRDEIPLKQGDKMVIIGTDNVAMDTARTALRAGAGLVAIVYRKREEDMPALKLKYHSALEEGVQFIWHAEPTQPNGGERASGITLKQGDQFLDVDADVIMLAIGSKPASRIVSTTTDIEVNLNGYVVAKEKPYRVTMRKGAFARGDVVRQLATIVLAMKETGKVAGGIASHVDAVKLLEL